jgi:predicted small lipoprotein YifL
MSRLAASFLLSSLSACGSVAPTSLPPIADKLPSDVRDAEPEFDRRVKAAYPVGSHEENAVAGLRRAGFEVSSRASDGYRSADIKRGDAICQTIWSVRWKAVAGRMSEVFGVDGFRCP